MGTVFLVVVLCRRFFVVLLGLWASNLFGGGSRLWSREGLSLSLDWRPGRFYRAKTSFARLKQLGTTVQCRVLVVEKLGYLLGRPFTARRRQGLIHSRAIESIPGGQQPRPAATRARRAGYLGGRAGLQTIRYVTISVSDSAEVEIVRSKSGLLFC